MTGKIETTFDSIESAHEFVALLSQAIAQAKQDIESDVEREQSLAPSRRLDALRLTVYALQKLEHHMKRSRCALNDLRTLRRLLLDERSTDTPSHLQRSGEKAIKETVRTPRAAHPSPPIGSSAVGD